MANERISELNPATFGPSLAPYSQGTVANGFCFVSGQAALDERNEVVGPGDARAQTSYVLRRIETILAEVGASLQDIVSATVFLKSFEDFAAYNEGWKDAMGEHRPARATVRGHLFLDEMLVEIQAVAVLPS
jgi:2-iminobutanoate/2-iminopropanoate deaminase